MSNFIIKICKYIISFVTQSPSGGQKFMKKTNLGRKVQLFKDRFKTCFDTAKSQSSTRAFHRCDIRQQSFDLRRVTAILLQRQNFGPNVGYSKFKFDFGHLSNVPTKRNYYFANLNLVFGTSGGCRNEIINLQN